jgi:glycerol-3-phosphate dehydrogenase
MINGSPAVLILGAGINGCALARELALNGVASWVVDTADVASGATAGSSRLIHGGLRYLEYGELDLVKESLAERTRLLRLAPQFVRPLRLWVPAESRFGGWFAAIGRFFGWKKWPEPKRSRGAMLVRAGLAFYDAYARDPNLPKHTVTRVGGAGTLPFNPSKYRWLCAYYDAQVAYPERLTLALLDDAREISARAGLDFRVLTYHTAVLRGDTVEIADVRGAQRAVASIRPTVIVNATGAWVDETLARLHVPSRQLMGGTKGSHFFTFHSRLLQMLEGQGIYAEARDGRPIFITPLGRAVLVGTTDVPFEGPPERAVASCEEIDYLLEAVDTILPDARLTRADVAFHYSAVRPLPRVTATTPAAITRRHALVKNDTARVPIISLVGGKLTTMRSLAESAAAAVLDEMGRHVVANSSTRLVPGAEDYPANDAALAVAWIEIAERSGFSPATVEAVWNLCGTRAESLLAAAADRELLPGTDLPCALARAAIEREWARTLADLVERRLMLLYDQRLTRACLRRLAEMLAEAGHVPRGDVEAAVNLEVSRLAERHGRVVE